MQSPAKGKFSIAPRTNVGDGENVALHAIAMIAGGVYVQSRR
jgi:hypothetical protein